jgi:UMF1 family MFS transporter
MPQGTRDKSPHPGSSFLARLGLDRPELRAWAAYDLANAAVSAVMFTAIFPIFFEVVAGHGLAPATATFRFSVATTLGLAVAALLSPIIGTISDYGAGKKRLMGWFVALGMAATAGTFLIGRGAWLTASVLFVLANIGATVAFAIYDALLPSIARGSEMDRVSTAGYAVGYIGSGLLLAVDLMLIQHPGWFGLPSGPGLSPNDASLPTRLAFVILAVFWGAVTIPLMRRVPEPPALARPAGVRGWGMLPLAVRRMRETLTHVRAYREACVFLIAFLVYNDGIGTIIRMAGIYGKEVGIGQGALIGSILLVQFIGVPFGFAFGALAGKIGARPCIYLGLGVYTVVSIVGYFMTNAMEFLLMAVLVGMVQGGTQALSRSLFASMIPQEKAGEFFGFFAVGEKFAGVLGPAVFAVTIAVTGSSRGAVLSVIAFFIIGALLLSRVDVGAGQAQARRG